MPIETSDPGCGERTAEFTKRGDQNNESADEPVFPAANQADLSAHPRVGKEFRQEQHDDNLLQPSLQRFGNVAVVRNDDAQQKRAKDRMNADGFGRPRRKE